MAPDALLNLLWAAAAVGALGLFALTEWRRRYGAPATARCRRGLAVLVAAIALFPSVSASDDCVRMQLLDASTYRSIAGQPTTSSSQTPSLYLARLSEVLENSRVSSPFQLVVTFNFLGLIRKLSLERPGHPLKSPSSRAPPSSFAIV